MEILYEGKDIEITVTISFPGYTFTGTTKKSIASALILADIPDHFNEGIPKGLYLSKDPNRIFFGNVLNENWGYKYNDFKQAQIYFQAADNVTLLEKVEYYVETEVKNLRKWTEIERNRQRRLIGETDNIETILTTKGWKKE